MSKICGKCGQRYPDNFQTCTCRYCGDVIERSYEGIYNLSRREYEYEEMWQEWQKKYNAAAPQFLTESAWEDICAIFNRCCICNMANIEEKLLVVPPRQGGKLYTYNVVPACEVCAKRVRQSQSINPIKSFYTIAGSDKQSVDMAFRYLDTQMLQAAFELFDFDEDSIEITVVCTEDTSILPFTGIFTRRLFEEDKSGVDQRILITTRSEETYGVTWRLIDE